MTMIYKVEKEIAGRTLRLETGKLAKQSHGSVLVSYGETIVLATVVYADPREDCDFFPLTVDYRERTAAAGKFPGGFIKREGRPSTKEILTMRMIDRPLRPLFPKGFFNEVQIQTMVLSADLQNEPDILAMIGASACLAISEIPFDGPLGAVRIGRINDNFVINPTYRELEESSLELVLGGTRDLPNMIEIKATELPEEVIADAIEFGHKTIVEICDLISELAQACGKEKIAFEVPDTAPVVKMLHEKIGQDFIAARAIEGKKERDNTIDALFDKFKEEIFPENSDQPPLFEPSLVSLAIEDFKTEIIRTDLMQNRRAANRGMDEIRTLSCEVGLLPRTHGSALFTRGETQSMVSITLGTTSDEQIIDGLQEEYGQRFMLHYSFPPFCVGEVRRITGPGRREIGHGALAEKSLEPIIPSKEKFPYTIRINSDVLESNGSSSMATVCGGTLALMDAGVPIKRPVAGISIGMVSEGDKYLLLTDILGEEDHFGDMDFKVAGSQKGITGIQLDLKARGLKFEIIREVLQRARDARIAILKHMLQAIDKPRPETSEYAPRITTITIPVDMIGAVIGPGGREIKRIQESTGTKIDIEDDGTVHISCVGGDGHMRARSIVELMTMPLQVGKVYEGRVVSIKEFGAFIELAPGREGLCHVSELSGSFVKNVSDFCKVNDMLTVKVIAVDPQGRIKLSHKAVEKKSGKKPEQENNEES